MFDHVQTAPPDPILGLEEAFKRDRNPAKINLAAGVYRDESGATPVLRVVKRAEAELLESETSKTYLPIVGSPEYASAVQDLVFGPGHPILTAKRCATVHAPGGTGALRVAADIIKRANPSAAVWISQPTWPNHAGVMKAAGLEVHHYPYFDPANNSLDFDGMMAAIETVPAGDVLVLHGSCHNPTGCDPTPGQWVQIADLVARRGIVPLVDFAYQGFAAGLREDTAGVMALADKVEELLIASSFSKNFALYNERVGALTLVARSQAAAEATLSQIKTQVRTNYSNPPAHGARIVITVLGSPELRGDWEQEVAGMRDRIHQMRKAFVAELRAAGVARDFSFIENQHGMFSFTGLTREQVLRLREEYSIYIVDSGRVNVAGLTPTNLPIVCRAIASVL